MNLKIKSVFTGDRGVRAGWRYVVFFTLATVTGIGLSAFLGSLLAPLFHIDSNSLNSAALLLDEVLLLTSICAVTWVAVTWEGRRIDSCGLPIHDAFRGHFREGAGLGIAATALVAMAMYAMGGFVILGFGLQGSDWFVQPLLWSIASIVLGIAEEMWFRGYGLQVLTRGVGFWPAAVITSLIFGALHLGKDGENFIDIFNIIVLGFFLCVSVRKTGSLWLAVGFHVSFDLMQFFVIGTQNGGAKPVGTLFQTEFPGPAWVNGGTLGTEASYFMLPIIVGLYIYLFWRYPKTATASAQAVVTVPMAGTETA